MKKLILKLALIAIVTFGIVSCDSSQQPNSYNQNNNVTVNQGQQVVPPQQVNVEDDIQTPDFDVNSFSQLVSKTANAQALEKAINAPNNPYNHLHLNDTVTTNGYQPNTDYLKVDQVNNTQLVVYDETQNNKVTVATLTINTQNNSYQVAGSPTYCGSDPSQYTYQSQSGLSFGQLVFLSWMIRSHSYYHPYWGYGRGYYGGYHQWGYNPVMYRSSYRTTYIHTHPNYTSSPNYIQRQNRINQQRNYNQQQQQHYQQQPQRRSLNNASSSQGTYKTGQQQRFNNSGSNYTGFSNNTSSSRRSSSGSSGRSSFGSSRSSFGGGKRR